MPAKPSNRGRDAREPWTDPGVVAWYEERTDLLPAEALLFERYVGPGSAVLDVGVGAGRTTGYLRDRADSYLGVDYSPAMVEAARQHHPDARLEVDDATRLDRVPEASVDVAVFSFNGIDYVDERGRASVFAALRRVLRPGGVLIFSSHNPRFVQRPSPMPFLRQVVRRPRAVLRWLAAFLRHLLRKLTEGQFWRGRGSTFDPAHGGVHTYAASPRRVRRELRAVGFLVEAIVPDDEIRSTHSGALTAPWYYYAARVSPAR
jgi:SAM-dependent methyltransferase